MSNFIRPARPSLAARLAFACAILLCARARAADLDDVISAIAEKAISDGSTAGVSIGVARNGEVVFARGFGFADLENDVPATEHTVYRIGSVTKQFTAAAILKLAEKGKLALGNDVTKHVPSYPTNGKSVTIENLLTHTSGIKNYTMLPAWGAKMRLDLTQDEMMAIFGSEPLDFEPGTRFRYSNSGYYLLGVIVERASGVSYEEYLRKNVFDPAGLAETYYLANDPIVKRRARGYRIDSGKMINCEIISMNLPYAAGSLGSTVLDLLKWQEALAGGKVVSPESYRKMTVSGVLKSGDPAGYGFGLFAGALNGHPKISHGGGINGFSAQLSNYPQDNLAIAVLANTEGANTDAIEKKIARAALGIPELEVKNIALSEDEAKPYSGRFASKDAKFETVFASGVFQFKQEGRSGLVMLYQGDGVFFAKANPEIRLDFKMEKGKAAGFTLTTGTGEKIEARPIE